MIDIYIYIYKIKRVKISSHTLLYTLSYALKLHINYDLKSIFNLKIVTSSHDLCAIWACIINTTLIKIGKC